MNLLFSNIDEFAKRLYVLIISVNLDSFSLTNHKVFIKFNKFPPPNFLSTLQRLKYDIHTKLPLESY